MKWKDSNMEILSRLEIQRNKVVVFVFKVLEMGIYDAAQGRVTLTINKKAPAW